jgi:hypothetical protein
MSNQRVLVILIGLILPAVLVASCVFFVIKGIKNKETLHHQELHQKETHIGELVARLSQEKDLQQKLVLQNETQLRELKQKLALDEESRKALEESRNTLKNQLAQALKEVAQKAQASSALQDAGDQLSHVYRELDVTQARWAKSLKHRRGLVQRLRVMTKASESQKKGDVVDLGVIYMNTDPKDPLIPTPFEVSAKGPVEVAAKGPVEVHVSLPLKTQLVEAKPEVSKKAPLQGNVVEVNKASDFLVIDIGTHQKVTQGMHFKVLRQDDEVADLEIAMVRDSLAAGIIRNPKKSPKPGDRVEFSSSP